MSIEQFEIEMASAGYNEEQIAEIKSEIQELVLALAQSLEEIIERFRECMLSVWEDVKETMAELAEKLNNHFQQTQTEQNPRAHYVPYNPPNDNSWYNQYIRKMAIDLRTNIKPIIIHRN